MATPHHQPNDLSYTLAVVFAAVAFYGCVYYDISWGRKLSHCFFVLSMYFFTRGTIAESQKGWVPLVCAPREAVDAVVGSSSSWETSLVEIAQVLQSCDPAPPDAIFACTVASITRRQTLAIRDDARRMSEESKCGGCVRQERLDEFMRKLGEYVEDRKTLVDACSGPKETNWM